LKPENSHVKLGSTPHVTVFCSQVAEQVALMSHDSGGFGSLSLESEPAAPALSESTGGGSTTVEEAPAFAPLPFFFDPTPLG